jgi:hypothetical protein
MKLGVVEQQTEMRREIIAYLGGAIESAVPIGAKCDATLYQLSMALPRKLG